MKLTKGNITRVLKAAGHTQADTRKRSFREGFLLSVGYLGSAIIVRFHTADFTQHERQEEALTAWEAALSPHFAVERKPSRLLVNAKDGGRLAPGSGGRGG